MLMNAAGRVKLTLIYTSFASAYQAAARVFRLDWRPAALESVASDGDVGQRENTLAMISLSMARSSHASVTRLAGYCLRTLKVA